MASEKLFENKVKRYLESKGIYALGTPKQNITVPVIGYYEKRWGGGQFTKSGLPDLHCVVNGISVESELKAPNGKPSELQLKYLDFINQSAIGHILVENPKTVDRIKRHIETNYPEFSGVPVICFDDFQQIIEKILNVGIKNT